MDDVISMRNWTVHLEPSSLDVEEGPLP